MRARACAHVHARDPLLFGAKSPSLWVKAACVFVEQAVKSAAYQANATVINSAVYCLWLKTTHEPVAKSQRSLTFNPFSSHSGHPSAQGCLLSAHNWSICVFLLLRAGFFCMAGVAARFPTKGSGGHCRARRAAHASGIPSLAHDLRDAQNNPTV